MHARFFYIFFPFSLMLSVICLNSGRDELDEFSRILRETQKVLRQGGALGERARGRGRGMGMSAAEKLRMKKQQVRCMCNVCLSLSLSLSPSVRARVGE
jgi:hypothetical protein